MPITHLQHQILRTLPKTAVCLTDIGKRYQPHFTLWGKNIENNQEEAVSNKMQKNAGSQTVSALRSHPFWGKVVVGTCDEKGRFEDILPISNPHQP